jgi:antitoxin (DNA-binding transcriptional repressor) of toxin-antitoxin stability system
MSTTIEIRDAGERLPELVAEAGRGVEVVLTDAGVPVARLAAIPRPNPAPRIPGLHAGTVWMSDDFNDPLPDEFWLGSE